MYLSSIGDWEFGDIALPSFSSTRKPTQTVTYAYPTGTHIDDIEVECYKDYDKMENAAKFSRDASEAPIGNFCAAPGSYIKLGPSDDRTGFQATAGPPYVWVIMSWADDQSGCGKKQTLVPLDDFGALECIKALRLVMQDCEGMSYDEDESVYAGGGWVLNTGRGCVLVMHFATTEKELTIPLGPKSRLLSATNAYNVTDLEHFESDDLKTWRVPLV